MKLTGGAGAGLFFASPILGMPLPAERLFKISLNPFAIGVNLRQQELVQAAVKYGFEAILPIPAQLAEMVADQRDEFLSEMKAKKLIWDAAGLPVDFRK